MIRIAELRRDLGYSQKQLADFLGVTQQAISKYESGIREPDVETIIKLSKLFNVSSDYLLGRELLHVVDKEDELTLWIGELLRPVNDGSFKKKLIHVLSKLDKADWDTIEKIFRIMKEETTG